MTKEVEVTPDLLVLGRMLWGEQADQVQLAENVDPGVFQSKATRALFLLFAREAPKGFTPLTIRPIVESEMPDCESLLARLLGEAGTTAFTDRSSIGHLIESATAWGTVTKFKKALDFATAAVAMGTPYGEVRGTLERHLTAIDLAVLSGKPYDDKADMSRRVTEYLDSEMGGLPFGYALLDRKVTPIMSGNLVIIAGRPGTGKSTDMRNWTRNWVKMGEPVVYFSLEMTGEEKLPLFACMDAGLDYTKYVERRFTPDERRRFDLAREWWVNCENFVLNERSDVTHDWLIRQLHRYRAMGFTTFVVDHFHRMRFPMNAKGEVRLAMAESAKGLKSWAVDHGARMIVGAQLTKGDKHEEPGDDNIREVAQVLDEADKIFLKWLPLVAGLRTGDGTFVPTIGAHGRRILASEADKKSDLGVDPTVTFLKIGKQRVRKFDGFVALPFNAATGVIADYDDHHMAIAS